MTQITNWRAELPTLLVVCGFVIALIVDVWVDAGNVRGGNLQAGVANLSYCIYGALFATAAAMRAPADEAERAPEDAVGNVSGFVPALTILVAIVLVLGTQVSQSGLSLATTAVLVLVGAVLLVVRQLMVREELRRLHRELAVRQADARLTELVRRSADAIVVINAAGIVSYVSPASATVLGAEPATLVGTRAVALLGVEHEALLDVFLRDLQSRRAPRAELEVEVAASGGGRRALHVVGSDQSRNPLIDGTVLTLRDVTAERDLEREVLEVATRERQRLSGDIHEGLGQQLTGIALLLRGISDGKATGADGLRATLQPAIGHLNAAIEAAQKLARGLSPLQVVRGSFASALEQLTTETQERLQLEVSLHNSVEGDPVTGVAADHLYRIAQDSIAAAARRRGCRRIEIALAISADRLTLVVIDDGRGDALAAEADDLGLRMIGYRARLLGGSARVEQPADADGRVAVTIPVRRAGLMRGAGGPDGAGVRQEIESLPEGRGPR